MIVSDNTIAAEDLGTVMSGKKATFIFILILQRYIYLRIAEKQLNIANYIPHKIFLVLYIV